MSDKGTSIGTILRTLFAAGYRVIKVERASATSTFVNLVGVDLLRAEVKILALVTKTYGLGLKRRLEKQADAEHSTPIVISLSSELKTTPGVPCHQIGNFFKLLGGAVQTDRIFRPDLPAIINSIGFNKLPKGLAGKPDTLLEEISSECLRYLLDCPLRRYGQDRLFESLPDGIAFARSNTNFYYDAKAYTGFYHPSADDIKRFAEYINDFNDRYATFVGRIFRLLVISGGFSKSEKAIAEKNNDLDARCGTQMTFISTSALAESVALMRKRSQQRSAVSWRNVFAPGVYSSARLTEECKRIEKDAIIK